VEVDELGERFASLSHPPDDPDWLEVGRLARRERRRRLRPRLVLAVAAAVAAVVASAPAFGVGGKLVRIFESGEPAPAPIERSFAALDAGAPPGLATGVVASQTRKILLPGNVALWLAPTSRGGFCLFIEGGGGQCDVARALRFWPTFSIGGDFSRKGVIENGPVLIDGSTTLDDAASVEVQFEDGSSVTVPVVWVSAPIDAGFFGYEVPAAHLRVGARPTLLILRDANGNELRRDSSAFELPEFRQGPSTGLVPCVVRGGGDACLKAAFGSDAVPGANRPDPDPPSTHFHGRLPWSGR
jgi:hypothetical protein